VKEVAHHYLHRSTRSGIGEINEPNRSAIYAAAQRCVVDEDFDDLRL